MTESVLHSGAWGLALIAIVATSWIMYRFLAPKTWREWASAGVVQAFIIALYAEMYGFPLTIYLLARFFELDRGDLDAPVEIARHEVGGGQIDDRLVRRQAAAIAEAIDAAMLQETADDGFHADVFRQA